MTLAMSGATPEDAGLASGLVNTSMQVGGAIGLAVLATLSTERTQNLLDGGASQRLGADLRLPPRLPDRRRPGGDRGRDRGLRPARRRRPPPARAPAPSARAEQDARPASPPTPRPAELGTSASRQLNSSAPAADRESACRRMPPTARRSARRLRRSARRARPDGADLRLASGSSPPLVGAGAAFLPGAVHEGARLGPRAERAGPRSTASAASPASSPGSAPR